MNEDNIITHYSFLTNQAVAWFVEEEERLHHANVLLARCLHLGFATSNAFLSLKAISIFLDIARLYALDWKGGSSKGKQPNIERNREEAYERLLEDYFCDNPTYGPEKFRRRFRMRRHIFDRIVTGVVSADSYFVQKPDATG